MLQTAIRFLVPDPAGALWLGAFVFFLVFGDFREGVWKKNLVLAALLLQAVFLVEIMQWGNRPDSRFAPWGFTAIYLITAAYAIWGVTLAMKGSSLRWMPLPSQRAMRHLVSALVILNAIVVFGRPPDDAGYYTNLGARRWVETGRLPYADMKLQGPAAPGFGAAATYGPVLYASHIPIQYLFGTVSNPAEADPMDPTYVRPKKIVTQFTCFAFYLLGLFALFRIVRDLRDPTLALGAVALYAASPYILGLGGDDFVIGGLPFISHIAPSSVMLLAFMVYRRPFLSGTLLAVAAGVLFYPLFVFPTWLAWRIWRREGAIAFAAGFAVAGLMLTALLFAFTPAPEGSNAIAMFLQSTLEHQEGVGLRQYGGSIFSFWGTHPGLAGFWQAPLFGEFALFKPTFLVYGLFCLATVFLARGRTLPQLAGLTVALTAGVQLWKTHATGSYVEWYLPFLLIAILCTTSIGSTSHYQPADPQGQQPSPAA